MAIKWSMKREDVIDTFKELKLTSKEAQDIIKMLKKYHPEAF